MAWESFGIRICWRIFAMTWPKPELFLQRGPQYIYIYICFFLSRNEWSKVGLTCFLCRFMHLKQPLLGGGGFKYFSFFIPIWGRWTHFDSYILRWVETTNQFKDKFPESLQRVSQVFGGFFLSFVGTVDGVRNPKSPTHRLDGAAKTRGK